MTVVNKLINRIRWDNNTDDVIEQIKQMMFATYKRSGLDSIFEIVDILSDSKPYITYFALYKLHIMHIITDDEALLIEKRIHKNVLRLGFDSEYINNDVIRYLILVNATDKLKEVFRNIRINDDMTCYLQNIKIDLIEALFVQSYNKDSCLLLNWLLFELDNPDYDLIYKGLIKEEFLKIDVNVPRQKAAGIRLINEYIKKERYVWARYISKKFNDTKILSEIILDDSSFISIVKKIDSIEHEFYSICMLYLRILQCRDIDNGYIIRWFNSLSNCNFELPDWIYFIYWSETILEDDSDIFLRDVGEKKLEDLDGIPRHKVLKTLDLVFCEFIVGKKRGLLEYINAIGPFNLYGEKNGYINSYISKLTFKSDTIAASLAQYYSASEILYIYMNSTWKAHARIFDALFGMEQGGFISKNEHINGNIGNYTFTGRVKNNDNDNCSNLFINGLSDTIEFKKLSYKLCCNSGRQIVLFDVMNKRKDFQFNIEKISDRLFTLSVLDPDAAGNTISRGEYEGIKNILVTGESIYKVRMLLTTYRMKGYYDDYHCIELQRCLLNFFMTQRDINVRAIEIVNLIFQFNRATNNPYAYIPVKPNFISKDESGQLINDFTRKFMNFVGKDTSRNHKTIAMLLYFNTCVKCYVNFDDFIERLYSNEIVDLSFYVVDPITVRCMVEKNKEGIQIRLDNLKLSDEYKILVKGEKHYSGMCFARPIRLSIKDKYLKVKLFTQKEMGQYCPTMEYNFSLRFFRNDFSDVRAWKCLTQKGVNVAAININAFVRALIAVLKNDTPFQIYNKIKVLGRNNIFLNNEQPIKPEDIFLYTDEYNMVKEKMQCMKEELDYEAFEYVYKNTFLHMVF